MTGKIFLKRAVQTTIFGIKEKVWTVERFDGSTLINARAKVKAILFSAALLIPPSCNSHL
jgi:hypothetical protein